MHLCYFSYLYCHLSQSLRNLSNVRSFLNRNRLHNNLTWGKHKSGGGGVVSVTGSHPICHHSSITLKMLLSFAFNQILLQHHLICLSVCFDRLLVCLDKLACGELCNRPHLRAAITNIHASKFISLARS